MKLVRNKRSLSHVCSSSQKFIHRIASAEVVRFFHPEVAADLVLRCPDLDVRISENNIAFVIVHCLDGRMFVSFLFWGLLAWVIGFGVELI